MLRALLVLSMKCMQNHSSNLRLDQETKWRTKRPRDRRPIVSRYRFGSQYRIEKGPGTFRKYWKLLWLSVMSLLFGFSTARSALPARDQKHATLERPESVI